MVRFVVSLFMVAISFTLQAQTSHLPLILINTNGQIIQNEPKINIYLKIIDNGPGKLNSVNDDGNQYDGIAGIEIRGESSQMFPKKSYSLELRYASGDDRDAALCGMPDESDWVLYAPYSDKTLLRNALSYYLGGRMGNWQPRFRFAELYMNGQYYGIYQLTEKIKRDKNRVNIPKIEPTYTSGDNLTGGYIFKVDKLTGLSSDDYFSTNPINRFQNARNYTYTYVYPESDNIALVQKDYIKNSLNVFENTLNSSDFNHPIFGVGQFINFESFIDFQIINELANNVDGYRYSTFFYKQRNSLGGKIFAGPLWDFDLSYGNVNYSERHLSTSQWCYMYYGSSQVNCMHWWARLMQDPSYQNLLKQRWTSYRNSFMQTDSIMQWVDSQIASLGEAVSRNFAKWPILGSYVWPNYYVGKSYPDDVSYLKTWIKNRLQWMDSQWLIPTGANPENTVPDITVYPNPASEYIVVQTGNARPGERVKLELYNNLGAKVEEREFYSGNTFRLNLTHSLQGIYLLKICFRDMQVTKKIVVV